VNRIRSAGGDAIFVPTDVSSRDAVRQLVGEAEREFGGLHIMTANAGILGRGSGKRLNEISEAEIEQIMAVNFWGGCATRSSRRPR
jgi:NAD(P)-dependent dehydrogenase (short-subunit alcohol dehydrogenase family)